LGQGRGRGWVKVEFGVEVKVGSMLSLRSRSRLGRGRGWVKVEVEVEVEIKKK